MPSNFYDLLKYAKTGIAAPNMTNFDKLRANALFGVYPLDTITGVPPLTFRADGRPLTAWSMLGNTQQQGTPTPDNPIMPEFVGERTENLYPFPYTTNLGLTGSGQKRTVNTMTYQGSSIVKLEPNTTYYMSGNRRSSPDVNGVIALFTSLPVVGSISKHFYFYTSTQQDGVAFTTESDEIYGLVVDRSPADYTVDYHMMLNTGSTPLPYEPYGYKLPITCAGQTIPVYLGQTPTVRRIKKLVLDGTENWTTLEGTYYSLSVLPYITDRNDLLSSHFFVGDYGGVIKIGQIRGGGTPAKTIVFNYDNGDVGVEGFKSWLSAQYAAGTPVTIWYVLVEPETSIVNEPLAKIGNYADELHSEDAGVMIPTTRGQNVLTVDTDLQPSEMEITYNK